MAPKAFSIRTKLSIAFGAALLLLVITGIISLVQLHAVNGVTQEIRETWLPKLRMISAMERSLTTQSLLAARRTQTVNFRELAALGQSMTEASNQLDSSLEWYAGRTSTAQERQLLEAFGAARAAYDASYRNVVERLDSGEVSGALEQFETETVPRFDALTGALEALETLAEQGTAAAEREANDVYSRALGFTVAFVSFGAASTVLAILWVRSSITSPLLRVSEALRRLTRGEEAVALADGENRGDEIGTLVRAAAGFRDSLIMTKELAAIAETDRQRLQAAISNMPIGLCMFDDDEKLIVCNSRFAEIYRLPARVTAPGTPYSEIIAARIEAGTFDGDDPIAFANELNATLRARHIKSSVWELQDGRSISTIFQPMKGGWLATHEDITERRRSEAQIRHMARHDALTDLPNRMVFRNRVEEALEIMPRDGALAVLCLDLDRFKHVNDTLGHPVGDVLLQEVSERLRQTVRAEDMVARFGGDEFAVVQIGEEQPAGARALAQRIIDELSRPFFVDEHQIAIGASVGIALAPNDGRDAEHLLRNADMALYRSKSDGRGVYRFFEQEMDARMQARRRLELDLRRALIDGEFCLYYQPVVDAKTGEATAFEALLRWKHPERGMVSPAEFIPLAEEIQLIVPLGEWVLKQACADAAKWPEQIGVAVNLSPVQFRSKNLIDVIVAALKGAGIAPERLELEITEGVLLANDQETLAMLHRLRGLGVKIAMDDFGTGYSSLGYLQSFPFDKIKIDASFIRRMSDDKSSIAIVRAVTGLGKSLGIATTAEGVETNDQLTWARAEGCTEVQGYLYSEPRPAGEVAEVLSRLASRRSAA